MSRDELLLLAIMSSISHTLERASIFLLQAKDQVNLWNILNPVCAIIAEIIITVHNEGIVINANDAARSFILKLKLPAVVIDRIKEPIMIRLHDVLQLCDTNKPVIIQLNEKWLHADVIENQQSLRFPTSFGFIHSYPFPKAWIHALAKDIGYLPIWISERTCDDISLSIQGHGFCVKTITSGLIVPVRLDHNKKMRCSFPAAMVVAMCKHANCMAADAEFHMCLNEVTFSANYEVDHIICKSYVMSIDSRRDHSDKCFVITIDI